VVALASIQVDLTGKSAVVTGASKGIGRAIAEALVDSGAMTVVNYRSSREQAEELVYGLRQKGGKVTAIQADVCVAEDVKRLFKEAEEFFAGPVDILVNNAGSQVKQSRLEEMPLDLWNRVIAVNLTSAMLCCRQVIRGMKQKQWGRIINISSISARSGGGPGGIHYASSKGGMSAFTKGLAKELGPAGITVNAIAPGVIMTEMHEKFNTPENLESLKKMTPLGRLGRPEDVVGAVLFLVSDSASYITGDTISINGGLRMD